MSHKKLKIFVDWQPMLSQKSGVGYYIENLMKEVLERDKKNAYTFFAFSFSLKHFSLSLHALRVGLKIFRLIPRSIYLWCLENRMYLPIEFLAGKYNIYFFGNFSYFPHIWGKSILVIHDLTFLRFPEFMEKKNLIHLRSLVPYGIKHATKIITVSESIKEELHKEYKIPLSKISVLYPKVSFSHTTLNQEEQQEIEKSITTYTQGKKYLLFIGNIEPRKNIIPMIEAYINLPKDIQDEYCLVLAGALGWGYREIKECIDKTRGVIYLGYISDTMKQELFTHASVFIFPSLYEGFGMPILEAMHAGVPVIASSIAVHKEVTQDGAYVFDPTNSMAITNAMAKVLTDKKLQSELIKKGYERVTYFKAMDQATALLKIFNELI